MRRTNVYSISAIAWKTVVRKLFRNIVLVLAVSLLVALLVFAFLFNKAVEEDIDTATMRLGAEIVIVPPEAKSLAEEFILESSRKTFYMDKGVLDSLAGLEAVKKMTHHIYLDTLASGCCSIDAGQVVVIDSDKDFIISPWLEEGPEKLDSGEVYVGSYVYEYLGLIDTATLFGQGVKVVGHLEKTGTGLDHGIFMRKDDLDKVAESALGDYRHDKISIIFLKLKEGYDIREVVAEIRDINPRLGIMTRGNIGADVRSTLMDIIRIFSVTILISSLLAILLAWSTFIALANERKREVGILRALGARQTHIVKMFLTEALFISFIGGLIGIGIGHYLIYHLAGDFHLLSKLGAVAGFNLHNVLFSLIGMGCGIIACLLGAAIPVYRLARLEPLLAIKEE